MVKHKLTFPTFTFSISSKLAISRGPRDAGLNLKREGEGEFECCSFFLFFQLVLLYFSQCPGQNTIHFALQPELKCDKEGLQIEWGEIKVLLPGYIYKWFHLKRPLFGFFFFSVSFEIEEELASSSSWLYSLLFQLQKLTWALDDWEGERGCNFISNSSSSAKLFKLSFFHLKQINSLPSPHPSFLHWVGSTSIRVYFIVSHHFNGFVICGWWKEDAEMLLLFH